MVRLFIKESDDYIFLRFRLDFIEEIKRKRDEIIYYYVRSECLDIKRNEGIWLQTIHRRKKREV